MPGLNFNVTYGSGVASAPAAFKTTVDAALQYLSTQFVDPITINLTINYSSLSGSVAQTSTTVTVLSYSLVTSALTTDATSPDDTLSASTLPQGTNPINGLPAIIVSTANAKALGLSGPSSTSDGTITINSTLSYDYNRADGISAGSADFFGLIIAQVTTIMGRRTGLTLDLFRYSAAHTHSGTSDPSYFSIDDGVTHLAPFKLGGSDAGNWDPSVGNDAFSNLINAGVTNAVTETDLRVMDVIGYDRAAYQRPHLLSSAPTGLAGSVAVGANITLNFDTAVQLNAAGNFVLHHADGTVAETISAANAGAVSVSGSTVTLNPAHDLWGNNGYYLTIDANTVSALNGNAYTGLTSPTELSFTTGPGPIYGDEGANTLTGSTGADVLQGFGCDDHLIGGLGADQLDGGAGTDTADYSTATTGITVFMGGPQLNTGEATGDTYISIENLAGSAHADILGGDNGANTVSGNDGNDWLFGADGIDTLQGGNGNDVLEGGAGADALVGGAGVDVASYRNATTGIVLDLVHPANNTGDAQGDSLSTIENIWGTEYNDTIVSNLAGGQVYGFKGDDILTGAGGNDVFYGGTGSDVITTGAGSDDIFFLSYYDHTNVYGTVEPNEGGDTITDFTPGADHVTVSRYWFGFGDIAGPAAALTAANADFITAGTTPVSVKPTFFWDQATGVLLFDPDGTGAGLAVNLATFSNGTALTLSDIWTA